MVAVAQSPRHRDLFELMGEAPELAARHGVSVLVADELVRQGRPVPREIAQDARTQIAAGLRIRALTLAVLDVLSLRGIVPVMLKGYALAVRLYPEQPLGRPSTDVDVLVSRDQLSAAGVALGELGLRLHRNVSLTNPFEEHHHLSFQGGAGLVEVHFRLFSGFGGGVFDDRAIYQRTSEVVLDRRAIRLLSPEDEFLYLAVHAANHAFLRVSWLVDLERYLRASPALDWSLIGARARAAGFFVAVASTLAVLERVLGAGFPAPAIREFQVSRLRRVVDGQLFSPSLIRSGALSKNHLASFLLRFWLVDSPAHGVRHLLDGARRVRRRGHSEG